MHRSGPLPQTFEGLEQGFRGKNAKMGSRRKPCRALDVKLEYFVKIIYNSC